MKLKHSEEIIPQTKDKVVLGQIGLTIAFILLSFAFLQVSLSNKKLSQKKVTFVQLEDGSAEKIEEKNENYRSDETIKNFVSNWLSLTFSWNGKISGTQAKDPGIKLNNKSKVPLNSWAASLAMEATFGKTFLEELTKIIPDGVFSGKIESAIYVEYFSQPRQISTNTWEIDVISTRILLDNYQGEERINFNKTFTLKAVEVPIYSLENDANKVEKVIAKMRNSGLEIQSITDFVSN